MNLNKKNTAKMKKRMNEIIQVNEKRKHKIIMKKKKQTV